jgi:type II secretory pathway component PulM
MRRLRMIWSRYSVRERGLLVLCGLLLLLVGGFYGVWQPLRISLARQHAALRVLSAEAGLQHAMLQEVRRLRALPLSPALPVAKWPVVLRRLADQQQFSLEGWRIGVDGGRLHLSGRGEFARCLPLFMALESRYQLFLTGLTLAPDERAGMVRVEAIFAREKVMQ